MKMNKLLPIALLLALCCGPLAGVAQARGTRCQEDSDIRWFVEERNREEATLLSAWVNGQLTRELLVPMAAQIMAWETRMATTCADTAFVAANVHLLNLEGITVEAIPGRLFLATLERAGLRGLRGRPTTNGSAPARAQAARRDVRR